MVAVSAGLVAGQAADIWGFVSPFIVCLIPLAIAGVLVTVSWAENYGDQKVELLATFSNAWTTIRSGIRRLVRMKQNR